MRSHYNRRSIRCLALLGAAIIFGNATSGVTQMTVANRLLAYYSAAPAIAPAPAPGVPPLPEWTLKARGAKPVMSTIVPGPGVSGPNLVDLEKAGYVEEEYFLTGTGNIYAVGGKGVVKADIPYTTRILMRRPKDPAKFSGNVIVEPNRDATEWGNSGLQTRGHLIAHGDVSVHFTMAKSNIEAFFQKSDPERYGSLSIPDDGLRWDIMAQTLGLMRNPAGPLGKLGFLDAAARKKGGLKIISTGSSLTGFMQAGFIDNGHHARARRPDGGPVVDGYLQLVSGRPENPPTDAPVIAEVSEGDMGFLVSAATRLPDSDGPARVRYYELSGTSHSDWDNGYLYNTSAQLAGNAVTSAANCVTPETRLPNKSAYVSGHLANLEAWLRDGTPPPPGKVFELETSGSADAPPKIRKDAYGNAVGGLRPFWIAVPRSTVGARSEDKPMAPGQVGAQYGAGTCRLMANERPLPKEELDKLYKSRADYLAKVDRYLKSLVTAGYLRPEGAASELKRAEANYQP